MLNARSRMRNLLRDLKVERENSSLAYLGCDRAFFKRHIESQFTEGMTWENYGRGRDKWVIDHIKPCCSFDLTKEEEQRVCFNWSNLRPLWTLDNISKIAQDKLLSIP